MNKRVPQFAHKSVSAVLVSARYQGTSYYYIVNLKSHTLRLPPSDVCVVLSFP